ncbi:MAG: hypothetical protein RBT36_02575 [Desulfobulbus sp.]|jgi:collagenase-like PrtC family protease|nr:hypothetical protein [Desulfobulbus sp.]
MNPILNVPFLPEEHYVAFLEECAADLDSVHFSLEHEPSLDSRVRIAAVGARADRFAGLARLVGVRKYALLNSRFHDPRLLVAEHGLQPVVRTLRQLLDRELLDGIVYCDHYLLQRLADEAPEVAARLEAVPGVNSMLDSFARIEAQLSYIHETGFRAPARIILDRSLNRDLDRLAALALQLRERYPGIRIELLANEGCLPYCPCKLSHDAYIALANLDRQDLTHPLNCTAGCIRLLEEQPHRLLQSPFIRPEDVDLYLYHVDTIKLCGRTLGSEFLMNAITAYRARRYDGNLLDLLDAVAWLAGRLHVDNRMLSFDFAAMLAQCDHRCAQCGFCREMFAAIAHQLPLVIEDRRESTD